MASFDSFLFLRDRASSIEPSVEQLANFDMYMTQMALSMSKPYKHVCNKTNTRAFFGLPKDIQCLAFTTLDGKYLYGKWNKSKRTASQERDEIIEKVIKLYDCSSNEAKSFLAHGLIDLDKMDELYTRIHDPDSIKFRKKK